MTASVAEKQVVGGCLVSQDLCGRVADWTSADFANTALGMIFSARQAVGEETPNPSRSMVAAHLQGLGKLEFCGGEEGLERLALEADVDAFESHREVVLAMARKRAVCRRVQSAGFGGVAAQDIPEAVAAFVSGIETDASDRIGSSGTSSRDATTAAMVAFFDRTKRESLPGNPTNIPSLNRALGGGFHGEELIILGARPSVGKTAEGLNMIDTMSVGLGIPSLVFSLEMSPAKNTGRLIVGRSSVSGNDWRSGTAYPPDVRSLLAAAERVGHAPITWGKARTLGGMIAEMTAWVNSPATKDALAKAQEEHADTEGNPAVFFPQVMVDHLHIIPNTTSKNAKDWLAYVTKTLKSVALDKLGIPLLALAQLIRASVREGRPPRMDDCRDGGGIEENADIIILIDRNPKGETPHEGTLIVDKNREGEPVNIPVSWDGQRTRYTERAADQGQYQ